IDDRAPLSYHARPMRYQVDFACRDSDPLQQLLNELYEYGDDLETKVLHRLRLNLFTLLVGDLIRDRTVTRFETAIDIGCNSGMYSALLSDLGFRRVLGIDVVPKMIATAERHFATAGAGRSVEFRLQPAETLAGAGTFDFLLCTEVIEHTNDPARTIENIRGLLAPGGVAVISMHDCLSLPY